MKMISFISAPFLIFSFVGQTYKGENITKENISNLGLHGSCLKTSKPQILKSVILHGFILLFKLYISFTDANK